MHFSKYDLENRTWVKLLINGTFSVSLQGVVYQLDAALESVETQKHGLVFIYDMSDSKYQNFDYDLSQKILTLLKVSFTPV